MRKYRPYIIAGLVAGVVAFAVSYFVSHSEITIAISNGDTRKWVKQYVGENKLKDSLRENYESGVGKFQKLGSDGFDSALIKLTVAKEKGFLTEEEYEKVVSIIVDPMQGMEGDVDIHIKTRIIEHSGNSEEHNGDNDDEDD